MTLVTMANYVMELLCVTLENYRSSLECPDTCLVGALHYWNPPVTHCALVGTLEYKRRCRYVTLVTLENMEIKS